MRRLKRRNDLLAVALSLISTSFSWGSGMGRVILVMGALIAVIAMAVWVVIVNLSSSVVLDVFCCGIFKGFELKLECKLINRMRPSS